MALSTEDRQQITELIQLSMTGVHARTEAKYDIIDNKLDGINNHLARLNGQVVKHQQEIDEIKSLRDKKYQELDDYMENASKLQLVTCPHSASIKQLLDESLSNKSVKRFMFVSFSTGIALGGLVVGIIKLILG